MADTSKQDVEFLQQFEPDVFWKEHGKKITTAVAVVVAIGLIIYYRQNQAAQAEEAAAARLAVAGTPGALQQIAQEFSGQGLAAQALLRLADIEFRAGRYKEAGEAYQQFLTGFANHTLADSAQLGLAQVQEAQGNFAAARTQYQQVASLHPNGYTAIAARVGAARCTESLGQKNEARQLYEELRPIVQGSGLETEVFLRYLVLSRSVESTNAAAPAEIKIP